MGERVGRSRSASSMSALALCLALSAFSSSAATTLPAPANTSTAFTFTYDAASGSPATTLPAPSFSVRKVQAIYYPADNRTYAYADIVNFSDPFYPVSYSSEVGVFSSPDGFTQWTYHGIVVPRGPPGAWDSDGIASPGAAVAADGVTVLVGYAGEHSPSGGNNRGIGLATAPHPLGPFTKSASPVASPAEMCGGSGRCDDVVMEARRGAVHLYFSVKNSDRPSSCPVDHCIRHVATSDSGRTWSNSTIVLSRRGTMETFEGRWFPALRGGVGGMILVTDGGAANTALSCFISAPGSSSDDDSSMLQFVPASPDVLLTHPAANATAPTEGMWAPAFGRGQVAFIPGRGGRVMGVSYSLWTGQGVPTPHDPDHKWLGYTHTVFKLALV